MTPKLVVDRMNQDKSLVEVNIKIYGFKEEKFKE